MPSWLANLLGLASSFVCRCSFTHTSCLRLIAVLTLGLSTPFLIGLLIGYVLHLALDMMRHHHEFRSPLFYLLTYRLTRRFRRDQLIKPEYL